MVIRDLTLRSAASFGSFHLIRLLYDEYMFYLIEQRVAQAINKTPVAVMAAGKLTGLQTKTGRIVILRTFHLSCMDLKYNIYL